MLLSLGFFLSTPAQASVLYNRIITCLLSKQDDCCELGEEFAFLKGKSLTLSYHRFGKRLAHSVWEKKFLWQQENMVNSRGRD